MLNSLMDTLSNSNPFSDIYFSIGVVILLIGCISIILGNKKIIDDDLFAIFLRDLIKTEKSVE